eukprot:10514429-Karenia_brevis.AAC.1
MHLAVSRTRTDLHDMPKFDPEIFEQALHAQDAHHVNALKSIASLSSVDQSLLHRFDDEVSETCVFCNACESSIPHIIWHCTHPTLVAARKQDMNDMQQHIIDHHHALP